MIIAKKLSSHCQQSDEKVIGPFTFHTTNLIGAGNQSKVYKGTHRTNHYEVAVKVIDSSEIEDNLSKKLLKNSLVSLETLKSTPHILNLHQIFRSQNYIYVVTELCTADLSLHIKEGLAEDRALEYLKQIIKGYKYIYDSGIVHRDLKPDNFFINHQSVLKIGDFGFSGPLYEVKRQVYYSIGSPAYMAPETLIRNQYSHESDIWSIGISFYEMLTGALPWTSKNQDKIKREMNVNFISRKIKNLKASMIAKKFLQRALEISKSQRMSPEELINYFDKMKNLKQVQKQIDTSTNWSSSNITSNESVGSRSTMTGNSFNSNHLQHQTIHHKDHLKKPSGFTNNSLLTPGFKRPTILNHLLSPKKNIQKTIQTGATIRLTQFLGRNKTEDTRFNHYEKKPKTRDLNQILHYFLKTNQTIFEFLVKLKASEQIRRKYSEDIPLMRICLKNVLIRTSQKIMNISESKLLSQYASTIEIRTYQSSPKYQKIQQICTEQMDKFKQDDQFSLYWSKAKEQNMIGAINATASFLKKIHQTLSHSYQRNQNDGLIKLTSLCLATINRLVCIFQEGRFQDKNLGSIDEVMEHDLTITDKILDEIEQILNQVEEIK